MNLHVSSILKITQNLMNHKWIFHEENFHEWREIRKIRENFPPQKKPAIRYLRVHNHVMNGQLIITLLLYNQHNYYIIYFSSAALNPT